MEKLEIKLTGTNQYNDDGGYRQDLLMLLNARDRLYYRWERGNDFDPFALSFHLDKVMNDSNRIGYYPNKTEEHFQFKSYMINQMHHRCRRGAILKEKLGGNDFIYGAKVNIIWKHIDIYKI